MKINSQECQTDDRWRSFERNFPPKEWSIYSIYVITLHYLINSINKFIFTKHKAQRKDTVLFLIKKTKNTKFPKSQLCRVNLTINTFSRSHTELDCVAYIAMHYVIMFLSPTSDIFGFWICMYCTCARFVLPVMLPLICLLVKRRIQQQIETLRRLFWFLGLVIKFHLRKPYWKIEFF